MKEFLSQYYMKGDDSGNSEEDESPVNIDSFVYTPLNIHLGENGSGMCKDLVWMNLHVNVYTVEPLYCRHFGTQNFWPLFAVI